MDNDQVVLHMWTLADLVALSKALRDNEFVPGNHVFDQAVASGLVEDNGRPTDTEALLAKVAKAMSGRVDISGLDKAAVLAVLYNAARPLGRGSQHFIPGDWSVADARSYLTDTDHNHNHEYVLGRALHADLGGDDFRSYGFNRDNGGPGTAERIVESLRVVRPFSAGRHGALPGLLPLSPQPAGKEY